MQRRNFIKAALAAVALTTTRLPAAAPSPDRVFWSDLLDRIATPVLSNMAKGTLHKIMPVEYNARWGNREKQVAYLECFGRLISGLSPWLTLPDDASAEGARRAQLRNWALSSFAHSVDPKSPDYLLWRRDVQPLVDSAYFANALIRAPKQLWEPLDKTTKARIVTELKGLRRVNPYYNNWLLFAAMNETFLLTIGQDYDPMRISTALRKTLEWYQGDGWYADGVQFHYDYYNSFVIHPMLVEILEVLERSGNNMGFPSVAEVHALALKRMQRYGEHLERAISPEGTFAPQGRSTTYRTAVFQPLALLAWRKALPPTLNEGRIRAALTEVHKRIFTNPSNFTANGFLTLGFAGHRPEIADVYSNSGSMYITTESFLPLALPPSDSFWTAPADDWTAKRAYSDETFSHDYAVDY